MPARLANTLLVLTSLIFTCGVVELALRIVGYEPLQAMASGKDLVLRRANNPDIGYELIPGAEGRAFKTDVIVNSLGFRSPEPASGDALRRVLILGDSITFGSELPAGSTYVDQLATALETRDPAFDVQNLALSGYDTLQEVTVLAERGLSLQPEIVVLGYCLNDTGIVSANLEYLERMQAYSERPWLLASRLAQLLVVRIDQLQGRRFEEEANDLQRFVERYAGRMSPIGPDESRLRALMRDVPEVLPSAWYGDEARLARLRYAFEHLSALRDQRGFRVLVVVFPFLEVDAEGHYPHQAAHAIVALEAGRLNLPVLDLLSAFQRHGLTGLRNDPEDPVHPSAEGHQLATRSILQWFDQARWL